MKNFKIKSFKTMLCTLSFFGLSYTNLSKAQNIKNPYWSIGVDSDFVITQDLIIEPNETFYQFKAKDNVGDWCMVHLVPATFERVLKADTKYYVIGTENLETIKLLYFSSRQIKYFWCESQTSDYSIENINKILQPFAKLVPAAPRSFDENQDIQELLTDKFIPVATRGYSPGAIYYSNGTTYLYWSEDDILKTFMPNLRSQFKLEGVELNKDFRTHTWRVDNKFYYTQLLGTLVQKVPKENLTPNEKNMFETRLRYFSEKIIFRTNEFYFLEGIVESLLISLERAGIIESYTTRVFEKPDAPGFYIAVIEARYKVWAPRRP
jgi:hypothetical protein